MRMPHKSMTGYKNPAKKGGGKSIVRSPAKEQAASLTTKRKVTGSR